MRIQIYTIGLIFLLGACIENDVPYPYIPGEIQELEVEGQTESTKIDAVKRTAVITVDEQVEVEELKVTKLIANSEAKIIPDEAACWSPNQFPDFSFTSLSDLPGNANTKMNFSNPVKILLRTYQDYTWTVTVNQVINRTISVENQVGQPIVDEMNRIVLIYVSASQSLQDIQINALELAGKNSKLIPEPSTMKDFRRPQQFAVYRGEKYLGLWTVDVIQTQATSSIGEVEIWAKKVIVSGGVKAGSTPIIEYKKSSDSNWNQLDASAVTMLSTTSFKAKISGLEGGTAYQWRILVDGSAGSTAAFTTEKIVDVPNLNFDTWIQSGKNWFANSVADDYEGVGAYWATGNEGVTSALAGSNEPITVPVEGSEAYKGKAARLRSITGVTLVGAAAGNLFIGKYKTNMMKPSASVSFGRPYSGARPTQMTGYYKYKPETINNGGTIPGTLTKDQCHIYIRLWDAAGNEFAYGEFVGSEEVKAYTKFTINIEYKDLKVRPASMTIVATSSRYGGEFEGAKVVGQIGNGSTLYVDEFELLYE